MRFYNLLFTVLLLAGLNTLQAQSNFGSEIVSYNKFGEGIMVTRAKIVPIEGVVSNFFFYNREDQPWNGNEWYEYDWEIRGRFPMNGWSQIRVRTESGGVLKDAPVNVSTNIDIGNSMYHWILIRKGNQYVYDIREDFNINTYNYNNAAAHGGNSVSLLTAGPRVYNTGGSVAHIPASKNLDFSLGVTAFDNSWAGSLPNGSYTGDMVVDFTRFHTFVPGANNFNATPQWSDEFDGNNIDQGKWLVANWTFSVTQFSPQNVIVKDGLLTLRVNNNQTNNGTISSTNIALTGTASQSSTTGGANASRAIDGNKNGAFNNGSVTHTQAESNAQWAVDLANTSEIDRIVIHNRTDCCSDRLANFSVSVADEDGEIIWNQFYSNTPSPSINIDLNVTGKKVMINLVDGPLSLAEVEVFGTDPEAGNNPAPPSTEAASNLALNGTALQSTTAYGGSASRAIDDNTNGNWNTGTITHTSNANNSWWQVELERTSDIEEIVLHNRTNCCSSRLSDFTVSVLDESGSVVWSQFYADTPSPSLSIPLNQAGKTVRVGLDGTLSLAEVQVFGSELQGDYNLAPEGIATQSSTSHGGLASRAIDKNKQGNWKNKSVTHTANESNPWWQVQLAETSNISDINIYGRIDNCCISRLSNYTVEVLNDAGVNVYSRTFNSAPNPSVTADANGVQGRIVRVRINGTNPLSLAEVEVIGIPSNNLAISAQARIEVNNTYFKTQKQEGRQVELNWLVDDERTPTQFEIEYSENDGPYQALAALAANANDNYKMYRYLHETPEAGKNTYRIKVLFADYSIKYLDPETVTFEVDNSTKAFPNPSKGIVYVNLADYTGTDVSIVIGDLSGKEFAVKNFDSHHANIVDLDMTGFENGLYMIYIKTPNRPTKAEKITLIRDY